MISNFSSFIEFFGALYLTMSVDNQYFKAIWVSKDNEQIISDITKDIDESVKKATITSLNDSAKSLNDRIIELNRRKGGFMLAMCILLLVFIGFEPVNANSTFYLPLLLCTIGSFVVWFCSSYFLTKWKLVVFFVAFNITVYTILHASIAHITLISQCRVTNFLLGYIDWICVLTLSLPILHHLFIHWMYHGVYRGYMKHELHGAIADYTNACEDAKVNYTDDSEATLTKLNEKLQQKFAKIASPSIYRLFYSLIRYYFCVFRRWLSDALRPEERKNSSVKDFLK